MACTSSVVTEGSTPVIELTFRDVNGDLENPSSILAVHRLPDGTEVSYVESDVELAVQSVGVWWLTLPPVDKGRHVIHVTGVGGNATAASTYRFKVRADGVVTV